MVRLLFIFLFILVTSCGNLSIESISGKVKQGLKKGGVDTSQLTEVREKNLWILMEKQVAERAKKVEEMNISALKKQEYFNKILSSSLYRATILKDEGSGMILISVGIKDPTYKTALPFVAKFLFGNIAFNFVKNQISTGQQLLKAGSRHNPYFIVSLDGKPFFCSIHQFELKCNYIPSFIKNYEKGYIKDKVVDLRKD